MAAAHRLAQASFAIGDVGQAAVLLRQNVEALEAGVPDPRLLYNVMSRAGLGLILGVLGDFAQGRSHGEEALRLSLGKGGSNKAIAHGCLGLLYLTQGDLAQARTELSAAIALYRAMAMTFWLPQTEAALARVL